MTKLAIYMYPTACSRVTMTALEEIGLDYEVRPVNLLANEQKGDDDAAEWLPDDAVPHDTAFDCMYVIRQITIKTLYKLTVNAAEKKAMSAVSWVCVLTPCATL